jgi:hypothetical protein
MKKGLYLEATKSSQNLIFLVNNTAQDILVPGIDSIYDIPPEGVLSSQALVSLLAVCFC